MKNEAHEWLREWVTKGGIWNFEEFGDLWYISLVGNRSESMDFVKFRDDMKRLLDAAERGGLNE